MAYRIIFIYVLFCPGFEVTFFIIRSRFLNVFFKPVLVVDTIFLRVTKDTEILLDRKVFEVIFDVPKCCMDSHFLKYASVRPV